MCLKPVSYTHLDVYKRQVLYEWKHALPGLSIDSESTQRIQIDRELRNAPAMGAFMQLAAMLLVIAVVCILMYFSQSEEKLSIKKMFGYSSFHLLIKENWKLFMEVLMIGILTVSYTHLDVYKRQSIYNVLSVSVCRQNCMVMRKPDSFPLSKRTISAFTKNG